jgi:SHS2 domain-containing protein
VSLRKPFEFLEHTADVYIAAHGGTLEEAFGNAALGMFEVMTDTRRVAAKARESVKVEARDEYALLYRWLEELLVRFEVKNRLYCKFNVRGIRKTSQGFSLEAVVWGEEFDPSKHPSRTDVKAVTYHQMEIARDDRGFTAKFILDI